LRLRQLPGRTAFRVAPRLAGRRIGDGIILTKMQPEIFLHDL
jgi:hypothetical protein